MNGAVLATFLAWCVVILYEVWHWCSTELWWVIYFRSICHHSENSNWISAQYLGCGNNSMNSGEISRNFKDDIFKWKYWYCNDSIGSFSGWVLNRQKAQTVANDGRHLNTCINTLKLGVGGVWKCCGGVYFNTKMDTYQHRNSHNGIKMILQLSCLKKGFPVLVRQYLFIETGPRSWLVNSLRPGDACHYWTESFNVLVMVHCLTAPS